MALIAVNLSDKIIQEIRDLVENGHYTSIASFVEIGAFNQLALERGATPTEIIDRGHRSTTAETVPRASPARSPAPTGSASNPVKSSGRLATKRKATTGRGAKIEAVEAVSADDAKALFWRLTVPSKPLPNTLPMPAVAELGEPIFGQVNRLFPTKFVCRWLLHLSADEGGWPKYTAVSARLADDAGILGSLLDQWDRKQDRERGGELATALPRRKNNASIDRFLSQFVGRITRAMSIAPGAVCQYDFVRFHDSTLTLTEQGVKFARLVNPILDGQDENAVAALSAAEAEFLATHIRTWVPTECEDMRTVLFVVKGGKVTPPEVDDAVRGVLPGEWTDSMVQTHISGVIARLSDIRLLRRSWQGRNVRYELGDATQVKSFLEL